MQWSFDLMNLALTDSGFKEQNFKSFEISNLHESVLMSGDNVSEDDIEQWKNMDERSWSRPPNSQLRGDRKGDEEDNYDDEVNLP